MNKVKKILKNEKGTLSIEIAIGTLMFMACLTVILDLMLITWKNNLAAQVSTRVAREVGLQGGFLNRSPEGFPGGDNSYTTNVEIGNLINSQFKATQIKDDEWRVVVYPQANPSDKTIYTANSFPQTPKFDYREPIIVETTIWYDWEFVGNFLPFTGGKKSLTSRRATVSEWKYNYGSWENE